MKKKIFSCILSISVIASFVAIPTRAETEQAIQSDSVALGEMHTAVIKENGELYVWGYNRDGQLGFGKVTDSVPYIGGAILSDVVSVSASNDHCFAITKDGNLWAWGDNDNGQLGNGNENGSLWSPRKVMNNVSHVSTGKTCSGAVKYDGSLWLWGKSNARHNPINGNALTPTPQKIMDAVKQIEISQYSNLYYIAIIKNDNSLWTSGYNSDGQLGNGTREFDDSFRKIMDDVKSVSLGESHSAAITMDGSLWMWGDNEFGQLGNGLQNDSNVPIKVMDNVKSVSLGKSHSAAITMDGSLWIWGGESINTQKKIMENVLDVVIGDTCSAAVTIDGALWMWGSNNAGQLLGDDKTTITHPVKKIDGIKINSGHQSSSLLQQPTFTLQQTLIVSLEDMPQMLYARGKAGVTFTCDNSDVIELIPSNQKDIFETAEVSGVYVKALNPGTATITATAPDGTSAQCVITVEGKIAETIDDELILKAKICADNADYEYIKTSFNPPDVVILKDMNDWKFTAANANRAIENTANYLGLDFSKDNFYKVSLLAMLANGDTWVDSVYEAYNDENIKYVVDVVKTLSEDFPDTTAKQEIKKYLDGADTGVGDIIADGLSAGKAMYDEIKSAYILKNTSEDYRFMLEQIRNNTTITELRDACNDILDDIDEAEKETSIEIIEGACVAGEFDVAASFVQHLWDAAVDSNIVSYTLKQSIVGANLASEAIFSSNTISNDVLTMCANSVIENEMLKIMKDNEEAFLKNQNAQNARCFITSADVYKSLMVYSCDLASDYVSDLKNAELKKDFSFSLLKEALKESFKLFEGSQSADDIFRGIANVFSGISVDSSYDDLIEMIERIKQLTEEKDFYDPCGSDIALYIRDIISTTPSEWAKEYIDKAISYKLLDTDYQNNYQNNITRAEFCTLLTYLIDNKSDVSIEELAERAGRPAITAEFDDTMYVYVSEIAKLGIINGVGDNKFEPLGNITREQAAKMLCETAKVLGYDISAPQTDLSSVSDWAKEGVNFVVDRKIMTGTDNGFEPQGTYTKEQAITTMVRFFENIN